MITKNNLSICSTLLILLSIVALETGCEQEGKGFALPTGDVERGKMTFDRLHCDECHSAGTIGWTGNVDETHVALGGDVTFKKTYGELITAIINPSHKIAKEYYGQDTSNPDGSSRMAIYNEVMTVQELVDIVSFLEKEYRIVRPITHYPIF